MQVRSCDFLKQYCGRMHEKLVLMSWNAGRQVGEEQFIPPLKGSKPKRGCKIDADLPLFRIHRQFARTSSARRDLHDVSP
jgi:hypothetical protein